MHSKYTATDSTARAAPRKTLTVAIARDETNKTQAIVLKRRKRARGLERNGRLSGEGIVLRRLTFDMRGAQKAQPFVHPLDGRVRRLPEKANNWTLLQRRRLACPSYART
jgi:hypothetical protein